MGTKTASAICVVALGVAIQTSPLHGQRALFRGGTSLVDLYVTVTDKDGRLVPDLEERDFVVSEDGRPREIVLFETEVRPITAVIMLDTSRSTTESVNAMPRILGGAQQFLNSMLPGDRARIGAFNDTVRIIPSGFTDDVYYLNAALAQLHYGWFTKLWEGVWGALEALENVEGRKVVLVLTDGQDSDSIKGMGETLRKAVADEVMVYAIGLEVDYRDGDRWVHTSPDPRLRQLAEKTGGGYYELEETDQLLPTFRRVSEELHKQYVIAFEPTAHDGETHEIDIEIMRNDMTARARQSYVATAVDDVSP